ncbi:hypothetical protein EJB05_30152 [Eragrostis curvula]|uniref:Pentacotripeptide-repeat region of PRORP domain-containing protein n=1 Tax=Eragrostis curvula TaxID=38414 RepID=A0A5J9UUT6_9POAL|nr:hypothetical protein EJB05_30152 [Eragrostis curvula]
MMSCGTACSCSLQMQFQQRSSSARQKKLPAAASPAASRICSSIPEHDEEEEDSALLALLRAHDTDAAFALFSSNPDLLPCSPTTASRLLAQLSFNSSFSRAALVLQRLRARNALSLLDANALSLAAAAAARSGNATLAHSLILYMLRQGLFPDRRAYTATVARLSPASPRKAVRLFDAVLRHLRDRGELEVPLSCLPDTAAFNAALNACADAGDCSRFRQLWLEMQEQGCAPDSVSYNIFIKMCARLGRKDLLPRVLHSMLSLAGVAPCATTFHSLVAAYVGFGDIATAETIVQAMREGRKDISSLLLLRDADVSTTTTQEATVDQSAALLDDILLLVKSTGNQDQEVHPNLLLPQAYPPNARVYTTLMKGYMNAARIHDVLATLRAMRREAQTTTFPASRPDHVTYTAVISALVAAGDVDRARAVLDGEMAADGVPANRVTYNVLLKGYCHNLQMAKARELFATMLETNNIEPDVVTYNTLMDGCVLTDDTQGALALFNEMRSRGIAPSTVSYTTLMKAFAAAGQPKTAHKVFHQMQSDPTRVKVDRAAWNMLIEAYCRVGQLETAKQVVFELVPAHGR